MESKGLNKKIIIGAAALIVMIAVFLIIFNVFREKPVQGSKSITLEVLNQEKQTSEYQMRSFCARLWRKQKDLPLTVRKEIMDSPSLPSMEKPITGMWMDPTGLST